MLREHHDCSRCNGEGLINCPACLGTGVYQGNTCPYCNGETLVNCPRCSGTGNRPGVN